VVRQHVVHAAQRLQRRGHEWTLIRIAFPGGALAPGEYLSFTYFSTIAWNSSAMRPPFSVTVFSPSTYTGATGVSLVPGRLMPMLACFDSPGPFTTQPITATRMFSAPGCFDFQTGIWSL